MNELYFRMCGNAFDDGYRLDKVVSGLSAVQNIFDGTYKQKKGTDLFVLFNLGPVAFQIIPELIGFHAVDSRCAFITTDPFPCPDKVSTFKGRKKGTDLFPK